MMKYCNAVVSIVTLSLSVLHCGHTSKAIFKTATEDINGTASCHENYMAIHIAKEPFQRLKFTIYVKGRLQVIMKHVFFTKMLLDVATHTKWFVIQMSKAGTSKQQILLSLATTSLMKQAASFY